MTTKSSRILNEMHSTAQDLNAAGFITKKRMLEYDALCLEPIPDYTSEKIHSLRQQYKLSQAVMASIFNVSDSTIQKWERGDKHPSGPSLKLLSILEHKGLEALI